MRIALTGASGFVGRAVLRRLAADGHAVRALYRRVPADLPPGVTPVAGDLQSRDALFELVAQADAVLHVAGAVRAPTAAGFHAVNAQGTAAVADAAHAAGVRRFVHVSSLAARRPGLSAYAASKKASEDALLERRQDFDLMILRPAAIYGPGDQATLPLLKAMMSRVALVPGRPFARFSLLHVDDFAAVCASALASGETGLREIDDLSGGYGWADLKRIVSSGFGRPLAMVHLPYGLALAAGFAASAAGRLTENGFVFGAGKVQELYEPDWTVQGPNWPRQNPIALADGLPATIRHHQQLGDLPMTGLTSRTRAARET